MIVMWGSDHEVKVAQSCLTLRDPHGLYSPWNSPGQNTGMGSLSLLQRIFPIQGLNWGLLHCRQILYQLSYQGSPMWEKCMCMCMGLSGCLPSGRAWNNDCVTRERIYFLGKSSFFLFGLTFPWGWPAVKGRHWLELLRAFIFPDYKAGSRAQLKTAC